MHHIPLQTALLYGLYILRQAEPMIKLQRMILFNRLAQLFWFVVDEDGILLHLVAIDGDELDLALLADDLGHVGVSGGLGHMRVRRSYC